MRAKQTSQPRSRPRTHWATAVACALACAGASTGTLADVIKLNNGDQITGTLNSISAGNVSVTTAYAADPVVIAMANVADIQTDGTYDVTLVSGNQVAAQLVENGLLTNGSVTPTGLGDISLLAPVPDGSPVWTNRIDALGSVSTGNSETKSLNIIGDSLYTYGRNEHHGTIFWGEEEAEIGGVTETTMSKLEIDYSYRRYLRDNWYAGGNAEFFRDNLKDIDSRYTIGATLGKLFWDNALGRFSAEAGISAVFEDLGGVEDIGSEINPALRWALSYNRFVQSNLEFYHNHEILAILGGGRGQIFDATTGLRFHLSDALSVNARINFRHETDPPEGAENTDVLYGVGVGYTF